MWARILGTDEERRHILRDTGHSADDTDVRKGATPWLRFSIIAAVLGMFQFGYNTAVINAPQKVLEAFYNESYYKRHGSYMPEDLLSFLWPFTVAVTAIGGMIGAMSAAPWSQHLGRKKGMLINAPFGIIAALVMGLSYFANSYEMVIVGRFIVGFNCGLYTGITPMYVSEVSPTRIRGATGTINQLAVTVGLILAQALGLSEVLGNARLWPLLLGIGGLGPLLQLLILPFCPESPRYLLMTKHDPAAATEALIKLRGASDVTDEIESMNEEQKALQAEQEIHMCKLCSVASLRLPLGVAIVMHLSQQLSGINCILFYSTSLFVNVGLTESQAGYATLAVGGIIFTMTLVTIPLMDRAGRKVLHLVGIAGMFIFSIAFTITFDFALQDESAALQVTSIVTALVFVVFFGLGPGSIPWMIVAEFFSQGPRPGAVSISVLVNWLAVFVVAIIFPSMQEALGALVFVPFTVLLLIFFLILLFLLPETKGKTYEEVAASFRHLSRRYCRTNVDTDDELLTKDPTIGGVTNEAATPGESTNL